jgi:hypothetical protein
MKFVDPGTLTDEQLANEISRLEVEVILAHATYPIMWVREYESAIAACMRERSRRPRIVKYTADDERLDAYVESLVDSACELDAMLDAYEMDEMERELFNVDQEEPPDYDSFGPTTDAEQEALEARIHGRRPE